MIGPVSNMVQDRIPIYEVLQMHCQCCHQHHCHYHLRQLLVLYLLQLKGCCRLEVFFNYCGLTSSFLLLLLSTPLNFRRYGIAKCYNRDVAGPFVTPWSNFRSRLVVIQNISVVVLYWILEVVLLRVWVIIANNATFFFFQCNFVKISSSLLVPSIDNRSLPVL